MRSTIPDRHAQQSMGLKFFQSEVWNISSKKGSWSDLGGSGQWRVLVVKSQQVESSRGLATPGGGGNSIRPAPWMRGHLKSVTFLVKLPSSVQRIPAASFASSSCPVRS